MSAPKGNEFWRQRATHGAPRKYEDPEALWDDCVKYFEWVEENPFKVQINTKQGLARIEKIRPMTIGGLCLFLGIDHSTWGKWRDRDDLSQITARVDTIIYEQKFAGAASDQFNANIISRDLGLADKRSVEGSIAILDADDSEL
jgi:uncharacterized protein (UPF0276 family)